MNSFTTLDCCVRGVYIRRVYNIRYSLSLGHEFNKTTDNLIGTVDHEDDSKINVYNTAMHITEQGSSQRPLLITQSLQVTGLVDMRLVS